MSLNTLKVLLMTFSWDSSAVFEIGFWATVGFSLFLWFFGACFFGAGFAAFVTDRKKSTLLRRSTLCPEWVRLVVIGLWMGAQVLYFFLWATIAWWQVLIWGFSIGIAFFALGEIAYKMGRPQFFIISAIVAGVCWYTWPKPKEYALLARDTAVVLGNDAWKKAQVGWDGGKKWWAGATPPTLSLAQAELEQILNKWKQGEYISHMDVATRAAVSNYRTYDDPHQQLGYQLKTWSIGPGRELQAGVYEFKVSLEVQKYGNLQFRTYFPEKTVTVIKEPDSESWACFAIGGIPTEPEREELAEMERQLMKTASSSLETGRDILLQSQGRLPNQ